MELAPEAPDEEPPPPTEPLPPTEPPPPTEPEGLTVFIFSFVGSI